MDTSDRVSVPPSAPAPFFVGGRRIEWRDIDVPSPGAGHVLVRIRANAICGTDRAQYEHGSAVVAGHEAVGEIVAVGDRVSVPVGTLGAVYLMEFCGACRSCRLGWTNECLAKRADMGFTHHGGYGPYEVVHTSNFFPVAPDLDPALATLLLDVMGTTSHALLRARSCRQDVGSVLVAGAGPLGVGLVVMSRLLLGPEVPVIVGDVLESRLAFVRELGGVSVDLRHGSFETALEEAGLGGGADIAVDTAGRESARLALLSSLGPRGVLVCAGHGEALTVDVSRDLIDRERSILGSAYFRFDALASNHALLLANREVLGRIVTARVPIDRLQEGLESFFEGAPGKVVIVRE